MGAGPAEGWTHPMSGSEWFTATNNGGLGTAVAVPYPCLLFFYAFLRIISQT